MENESPTTTDDATASENLELEEAFITLETQSGKTSQKIPLVQFLEKVMGCEVNNDTKSKALSFLMSVNKSSAERESNTDSKSNCKITKSSENNSETEPERYETKPEEKEVIEKSKGRGRPRKVKIELKVDDVVPMKTGPTSSTAIQQKKDEASIPSSKMKNQASATPLLRRSSRVPTKNSKFKDDFVDSSIITSKGSASGDTRLMTLALAAECHTTKPNKQPVTVPLTKLQSGSQQEGNSYASSNKKDVTSRQENFVDIDIIRDKDQAVKEEGDNNQISCQANEPPISMMDCVLERTLQSQLNLCITNTVSELSYEPVKQNTGDENSFPSFLHYYVITEPKDKLNSNALLIQKINDGIKFNIANVCGNVSKDKLNMSSDSDPPPNPKYFRCSLCEKIFVSASQLHFHSKEQHSVILESVGNSWKSVTLEKEIHSCTHCHQKFPFKFMLDNHLQKQEKCNTLNCLICNQKFCSQEELQEHKLSAHPLQKCVTCLKYFDDVTLLQKHSSGCQGMISLSDSHVSHESLEVDGKLVTDPGIKSGNVLTSQEEELYRRREDNEMYDNAESDSVDRVGVKVGCELCGSKFSTYSGLWHHKLENHQEFFPSGLKEKLEARLEKNQQMLSLVSNSNTTNAIENRTRNNYFVVMKPKWYRSKMQLKASMEHKKMNFTSATLKSEDSMNDPSVSGQPLSHLEKGVLFHCIQCSAHYQSASEYREHRSQVHNECFETVRYLGAFQCTYCSDTFPCQFMLQEHTKQHTGRRLLPCTLCGLTFHKIQDRRLHWKQVHPGVGCPNCGKMYASIKYLQKHISLNCQDHYPATKKFIAFRKKQHNDFVMDEREKRVERRLIKCHLCSKICSSVHGWRRHMSECHEDEGFSKLSNTCIICNEVIYGYKALEKHLLEVHAEDSGLPIEEENTIVKQAVEKSKVHIQEYNKAGKSYSNIFQDEEGMFHCPECPKTHSDIKAINIHIKTHVNMQLECSLCKKSFKNPTLLKQHVMRHRTTAVYSCDTCGKKFLTLQKLNKHNKVHHSKENFVCELCGMSFALNDYLLKHKKSHTDNRPHSCSVCGKTFRTKPELKVHILIHTQETPYVCEHCGRGFTQKGNWRIHLAQHTGVKPHKCHLCELSFALPSHLKRHLTTHNQKINYRCTWCDKECTQRKHMQMHVSRVHKEDFFQYEEQMKLDNPVPIALSQMKIYNRRLGKAGQVRKAYKTRAKKCNSSIQDILDGVPVQSTEEEISESVVDIKPMMVGTSEETVTSDISIPNPDITTDNMQILVSEDHQNYVKHDIPTGLIEEDGSNVEIVMGENNEINIIINSAENAIGSELALQDGLDESGPVSLTHFTDPSGQLPSSLQQAVNALVAGQKGEDVEVGDDSGLPLDMDAMITGDNYTIVYPSGS